MQFISLLTCIKKLWLNTVQEITMPQKQKMPQIIYDPKPLNCIGREEWEMPGWITPEIPRGFFNTTNRTAYSVEEDVEDKDENSEPNIIRDGEGSETKNPQDEEEDDDDLVFMGEHAQKDDEEDDDEEQIITVMQPRYTRVFETFGQQIRTDDIAPPQANVETQQVRQVHEQTIRRQRDSGIPPRPPTAQQKNRKQNQGDPQATKKVKFSTLLPPRDPQLHRSVVTPPCPINIGELQTPLEKKQYTHVSFLA